MFKILNMVMMLVVTLLPGVACSEDINPVVGKTSNFMIRAVDLDRIISSQPPEVQKKLQDEPEQRVNLVKQLLIQKAIAARAKKEGFDNKPDIKEQLSYVIDDFISREYLAKVVTSSVAVREDDLKKYYKEKENTFAILEKIKVRHIFFETAKDINENERSKIKTKAEAIQQRLKKGEDFAKVAQEVSDDKSSAVRGGELGTIFPGSTSSEDFEKAAFSLKAGETSGVVTTPYGFHIIRVDERTEKRTATFDEARDYISKKLQEEAVGIRVQEFVEQVSKDADLEVYAGKITGLQGKGEDNEKPK